MNEMHFVHKVRQHLNRGIHDLPEETVSKLEKARQLALARQKIAVRQSVLAAAGSFVQQHLGEQALKQALMALVVVLGLATYTYWYADQSITELEIIDSALLSDDLPIAAFTDRGFDAWLKSAASQ